MSAPDDVHSATAIVARAREALKIESDAELGRVMGVSRDQVAKWKARDSRPYPECLRLAQEFGLSLEWLLTGEGEMRRPAQGASAAPAAAGVAELFAAVPAPAGAVSPAVPPGLERRIDALSGVLAQLDPAHSDEILAHALSRATDAQRLAVLEQALLDLAPARKRA